MKKLASLLGIILVVLIALGFTKNMIAKGAVESICRKMTGLELKIGGFNLSLIGQSVGIQGLKLFNPAGYEDRVMIDMPEIYAKIDVPSVFGDPIHVKEIRLDLRQLTIVKSRDGKLTLEALKPADKKAPADRPAAEKPGQPSEKKPAPKVRIDSLNLKVGKVVYKDYSKGSTPSVQEFDVHLNETHENIADAQSLIPIILQRAVMNTAVSQFVKLDFSGILKDFDATKLDLGSLGIEKGEVEAAGKAVKAVQGLFGALAGSAATDEASQ